LWSEKAAANSGSPRKMTGARFSACRHRHATRKKPEGGRAAEHRLANTAGDRYHVASCLKATAQGNNMPAITLKPLAQVETFTLENRAVSIAVEKKTGWIRSLYFKEKKIDLFKQLRQNIPGYIGGLRIYDEFEEKWFNDLNDAFTVTDCRQRGNKITFTKKFRGAAFTLFVTLILEKDAFHWEIRAEKTSAKQADRSMRVYFMWPIIAGWDVWAPAYNGEFTFDGMTSFEYMHIQVPYVSCKESLLPMISHFNKNLDVGFSIMEPIDAKVPASKFQFSNGEKCYNWGAMKKDIRAVPVLETVNYYIGLVGKRPMHTKIMMMFHEGDWRPGLGQVFKRWHEYFVPTSDTIYKNEGTFTCEGIQTADAIQRCKDFGIKTLEVHGHFQDYSDYYQEGKDTWHTNWAKETYFRKCGRKITTQQIEEFFATHTDAEIAAELKGSAPADANNDNRIVRHSRADIQARLDKLAQAGVGCYWYFNYTDGYRPRVEKQWPDAIARNEDGSYQASGWHNCHNMNSDLRWSFGKHMVKDAKRIFEAYPALSGFFLDCFRHYEIDFAHDDGITVVNNKPAYSMNFSYDDVEKKIKSYMIPRKLGSFANKPQSIRSMRWTDGVLLEGDGNFSEEKYFWACISKPLFFMWTSDKNNMDENLRRAVFLGCFPKYDFDKKASYEKNKAHFNQYLPLCAQFKRRTFCFEPDPLRVPGGSRGRLYTLGQDYIAGIMSEALTLADQVQYAKTPYAVFRVARGTDVGKAGVMLPGDKEWTFVKFHFDGTFVYVPLENYKNCAVVRLFVTKHSGKKIGPQRFKDGVDYCGDPESSFCDRNER
jgi:hypothetical protein